MIQLNASLEFKNFSKFDSLSTQTDHTLVLGIGLEDKKLKFSKSATKLTPSLKNIQDCLSSTKSFKGNHGESRFFPVHGLELKTSPAYRNLLTLGVGEKKDFHSQNILQLGGTIAKAIRSNGLDSLDIAVDTFHNPASSINASDAPKDFAKRPMKNPPPNLEQTAELLAVGVCLGLYTFNQYKKIDKEKPSTPKIRLISQTLNEKTGKAILQRATALAKAVSACRDMQTTPSNDLTPALLAKFAQSLAKSTNSIKVQVYDEKKLKTEKFGGILSVGNGSINPPRLIIMDYNPTKKANAKPIVLVGKGVTFDTGGTSLKPAPGMDAMKMDMSGAASVIAAVYGAALLKSKNRIIALVPSAENRISDRSTNPGDIYTAYNGKTVEVLNTDAEGRLILADALSFAATLKPAAVIDVATLTGACVVALGAYTSGLMGNDSQMIEGYANASEKIGERTWELPLYKEYADDLKSPTADYKNIGSSREAGASLAGCFLNYFVDDQYPWVHLDVAATADSPRGQGAHCPENVGTGVPVRGLIEFCESFSSYVK
ncbi:leucyl aminopeptidase [bacterium]|nr:leucyl aminopeptidase [bacterium]